MVEAWRGSDYDKHRLMMLGESAYSWVLNGETFEPSESHAREIVEGAIAGSHTSRFMTMVTRGLAETENPSAEEKAAAWAKVVFRNYIDGTVGVGPGVRPSQEQWNAAALRFRGVLDDFSPQNVIVLGKVMWGRMPEPDVYLTDDVQAYQLKDKTFSVCWAVQHPARGLSQHRLTQLIAFASRRELIL